MENDTRPYFAVYLRGDYSEELYEKQQKQKDIPFYVTIDSEKALKEAVEKYNLVIEAESIKPQYKDKFFQNYKMLIVFPEQGSSGVAFAVNNIEIKDRSVAIEIEQTIPEVMTMDMINRGILIAMSNHFLGNIQDYQIKVLKNQLQADVYNKDDLRIEDLQLGSIKVRMKPEELDQVMKAQPKEAVREFEGYVEKRIYQEGVEVKITEGEVSHISVTTKEYQTPRGLKVGDSVERLKELYGEPSQIQDNIYSFDLSNEYFLFHAEVKDGKIVRLQVNQSC